MIIDVHTHIVPEHFPPAGARPAGNRWPSMAHVEPSKANVMIAGRNFRTVLDRCWDVPRRLREMAEPNYAVDRQVLSPMPELLAYRLAPGDGLDLARYLNEVLIRMVEQAPDRFYALGSVPLQDVELAVAELQHIRRLGLHGVEVLSNMNGKSLGEPAFIPFFQAAEVLGVPIFVHAQHPTFMDRVVGPQFLENPVGFPIEGALGIASIITGKVMEACPKLRLGFSHGGGTFMQLLPRLENAWRKNHAFHEHLPKPPGAYARMFFYDDIFFDNRTLRYLLDTVGSNQIMIGSDYPFMFRDQAPEEEFDVLGLTPAEREAVGSGNCLRFLQLA
ncbi:MAG: amidohydrolase family protein [Candidatus Binatia bacterium]